MDLRKRPPNMLEFAHAAEEDHGLENGDFERQGLTTGVLRKRAAFEDLEAERSGSANFCSSIGRRFSVLLLLMLLQSLSSFELQRYADLLAKNIEITLFLTMLVGAGGNCSNQSAVNVIRGLATKSLSFDVPSVLTLVRRETLTGLAIAACLSAVGFGRVYFFLGDPIAVAGAVGAGAGSGDTSTSTGAAGAAATAAVSTRWVIALAISTSLFLIVLVSVLVGTLLPLGLHYCGLDPAHAGPSVQVVMDVAGVLITCVVCDRFLA